jgi:cation diffusion facilitator family transporter
MESEQATTPADSPAGDATGRRPRPASRRLSAVRIGLVSLAASAAIFTVKLAAWIATGSAVLLADALESTVNVVAAALMTYSLMLAARPADHDHPYGHGKAEFVSAGIEGALILVAAFAIVVEATRKLWLGAPVAQLELGLALSAAGAVANLALGLYLVRAGRAHRSEALVADGRHVLADVVTTAGGLVALVAVLATGRYWLDPAIAIVVALNIARVGWRVVRRALSGLLDEADFDMLRDLAALLQRIRAADWVDVHQLRARRVGATTHIDLHLVMPRFYSIEHAHASADALEVSLREAAGGDADVVVHLDPCRPFHCVACAMVDCPMREAAARRRPPLDVDSLTRQGRV